MIAEQEYNDAEEKYLSLSDKELEQLARQAGEEQPALFVYIATYYDFLKEDDNKDFFTQLIYSVWIAYTSTYKLKRKLSIDEVEKMDKEEERKLNALSENEDAILHEIIARMTEHPQSALLGVIYTRIGEFFGEEQLSDENSDEPSFHDAGIISGVINSFINLLEKTRWDLNLS